MTEERVAELARVVVTAQQRAARDQRNVSSVFLVNCAAQGVPFHQALIGALSTLGGRHGPVTAARRSLYDGGAEVHLERCERVPGFGSEVYDEAGDPNWHEVEKLVRERFPKDFDRIEQVKGLIQQSRGVTVCANAAGYTAVLAERLDVPRGTEDAVFIHACLPVWSELYAENRRD